MSEKKDAEEQYFARENREKQSKIAAELAVQFQSVRVV